MTTSIPLHLATMIITDNLTKIKGQSVLFMLCNITAHKLVLAWCYMIVVKYTLM